MLETNNFVEKPTLELDERDDNGSDSTGGDFSSTSSSSDLLRKWGPERSVKNGENNVEEMIGSKTKVFTSTIPTTSSSTISPATAATTTTTGEGMGMATTFGISSEEDYLEEGDAGKRASSTIATSSTANLYLELGLDLGRDEQVEKVELPNHTSLSATTLTTTTTWMGAEKQGGGDERSRDDNAGAEIVEPILLECLEGEEQQAGEGMGSYHHHHRHRHGGDHNSNYNRYESNRRRRRRWRNNRNGTGNEGEEGEGGRKTRTVACPAGKVEGNKRYHARRQEGVWKVGNWTLCETMECFTWNTGKEK